jgi:hypothetical protein
MDNNDTVHIEIEVEAFGNDGGSVSGPLEVQPPSEQQIFLATTEQQILDETDGGTAATRMHQDGNRQHLDSSYGQEFGLQTERLQGDECSRSFSGVESLVGEQANHQLEMEVDPIIRLPLTSSSRVEGLFSSMAVDNNFAEDDSTRKDSPIKSGLLMILKLQQRLEDHPQVQIRNLSITASEIKTKKAIKITTKTTTKIIKKLLI